MQENYKKEAKMDLEFVNLKENIDFQNLLN